MHHSHEKKHHQIVRPHVLQRHLVQLPPVDQRPPHLQPQPDLRQRSAKHPLHLPRLDLSPRPCAQPFHQLVPAQPKQRLRRFPVPHHPRRQHEQKHHHAQAAFRPPLLGKRHRHVDQQRRQHRDERVLRQRPQRHRPRAHCQRPAHPRCRPPFRLPFLRLEHRIRRQQKEHRHQSPWQSRNRRLHQRIAKQVQERAHRRHPMVEHLPRQRVHQKHPRQVTHPARQHHHPVRLQRPRAVLHRKIRRQYVKHRRQHHRIHRRRPKFGFEVRVGIDRPTANRRQIPDFQRPDVLRRVPAPTIQIPRQLGRIHRLGVAQPVELRPRVQQDQQQHHQAKHPEPKRPDPDADIELENPVLDPLIDRLVLHGGVRLFSGNKRHYRDASLSHAAHPFKLRLHFGGTRRLLPQCRRNQQPDAIRHHRFAHADNRHLRPALQPRPTGHDRLRRAHRKMRQRADGK